jgi:hypothetical protein
LKQRRNRTFLVVADFPGRVRFRAMQARAPRPPGSMTAGCRLEFRSKNGTGPKRSCASTRTSRPFGSSVYDSSSRYSVRPNRCRPKPVVRNSRFALIEMTDNFRTDPGCANKLAEQRHTDDEHAVCEADWSGTKERPRRDPKRELAAPPALADLEVVNAAVALRFSHCPSESQRGRRGRALDRQSHRHGARPSPSAAPANGLASRNDGVGGTVIAPFRAPHRPTEPHG